MKFEINHDVLENIRNFVSDFCEKNSINTSLLPKIFVCVDEITSNILNYSGASYCDVTLSIDDDKSLVLIFTDDGTPFNPLEDSQSPDVKADLEERNIGGLGIFMVKKMTKFSEYKCKDNLNVFTIKF